MQEAKQITCWEAETQVNVERVQARLSGKGLAPHFHDAWSIGVVLQGDCTFKSRGEVQHAPKGSVFAIPPYEVHESLPMAETVEYRVFYVEPDALERLAPRVADSVGAGRKRVWPMGSEVTGDGSGSFAWQSPELSLNDALQILASRLRAEHGNAARFSMNALQAMLNRRWNEPVALADIECETRHSRWHAIRIFKRQVGLTPSAYLRQLRALKSRHLLRADLTIAQAAHTLHFSDQPHYTRTFKQVFGVTPGLFQSLIRRARKRDVL